MYDYQRERPYVFTERGQVQFLSIRDRVNRLLEEAGAVRLSEVIRHETGDSWEMLACVDRLVELREIIELKYPEKILSATQFRVFVKGVRR